MGIGRKFLAFTLGLALGATVANDAFSPEAEALGQALGPVDQPPPSASVHVMLGLVWQGRDLMPYNIAALRKFRDEFRDVSFVHFLSPAYFLRDPAHADEAVALVRSVMRPHDQLALELGGWRSLASASGVLFRNQPTFWGNTLRSKDCVNDCGVEVPVNIYPEADLERLVRTSQDVLERRGFGRPIALSVEGWTASPAVLQAAAKAGLVYDFSAVAPELLSYHARLFPLYGWTRSLWPTITPHSQPYLINTPSGSLTEVPQSLATVDYASGDELINIFKEYVDIAQHRPSVDLAYPLILHQETAAMGLPLVARTLQGMFAYASAHGVAIQPMRLAGLDLPNDPHPVAVPMPTPEVTPLHPEAPPAPMGPPNPGVPFVGPPRQDFPLVH